MRSRRHRADRIKADRSYTVEELAEATGTTPQTVRAWIKTGLPALTDERPHLVIGRQAKAYLADRAEKARRPLGIGEFFCFRCKYPVRAALGLWSYTANTDPVAASRPSASAAKAHADGWSASPNWAGGTIPVPHTPTPLREPKGTFSTQVQSSLRRHSR